MELKMLYCLRSQTVRLDDFTLFTKHSITQLPKRKIFGYKVYS